MYTCVHAYTKYRYTKCTHMYICTQNKIYMYTHVCLCTIWIVSGQRNWVACPRIPLLVHKRQFSVCIRHVGFLGGSAVRNPPANAEDVAFPGLGRSPCRRKWQPTPVFLPGKSHGQRSLVGYSPWGHKELDMTERLKHHHHTRLLPDYSGRAVLWRVTTISEHTHCAKLCAELNTHCILLWNYCHHFIGEENEGREMTHPRLDVSRRWKRASQLIGCAVSLHSDPTRRKWKTKLKNRKSWLPGHG